MPIVVSDSNADCLYFHQYVQTLITDETNQQKGLYFINHGITKVTHQ